MAFFSALLIERGTPFILFPQESAAPATMLDNTRAAIERIAKRTHNEANGRGHDDDDIAGEEGDVEDFDRRMKDQVRKAHRAMKGEEGESAGKSGRKSKRWVFEAS